MRIVRSIAEFPANAMIKTGFVPTMGALHAGHLSLVARSKADNDRTVVSIFVNPTQFGPNEDFSKYPRPFERDCEMLNEAGADIVFAPNSDEIYTDPTTMIHVPFVTDLYEGSKRPGHFDGVATIVAKLLNIVNPNCAYFGEKDLQQCAVIKKMIADLNMPNKIVIGETIREDDGLAMSSRNAYLSPEHRNLAPMLYQCLQNAKADTLADLAVNYIQEKYIEQLRLNSFDVDYFDLVDRSSMHPISKPNEHASWIVAARLGTTRLIDNVRVIG